MRNGAVTPFAWSMLALIAVFAFVFFFLKNRGLVRVKSPPPPPAKATPARLWIVLVATVALITWLIKPRQPGGPVPPQPDSGPGTVLWTIVLPPICFVGLLFLMYLKSRDPLASRAMKRSREGDTEGAIELLREGIEGGRATGTRLNSLGCLYSENKDYASALKHFLDAEKIDGRQPIYVLNQVNCLRNLGRPTEAAALLEEVQGSGIIEFFRAYHACLLLADLGQFTEAREALGRAERARVPRLFAKAQRETRAKMLLECRNRLEGKVGNKTEDGDLKG